MRELPCPFKRGRPQGSDGEDPVIPHDFGGAGRTRERNEGERGMEFDPAMVPVELAERAEVILAQPAWEGRSAAQELHELRVAERRQLKRVPGWFSVQDLLPDAYEREVLRTT
jgi:hypothetical protein